MPLPVYYASFYVQRLSEVMMLDHVDELVMKTERLEDPRYPVGH